MAFILKHYRSVLFWLIVSLGLVLGGDPVYGSVSLVGLAAIGAYLYSGIEKESVRS